MKLCQKFNHWQLQENEDKKKDYCKEQFDSCSSTDFSLVVIPTKSECCQWLIHFMESVSWLAEDESSALCTLNLNVLTV